MIRVGVDAWNLPGDRRGIGRYVRALLAAWRSCEDRITVTLIVPEHHTWIARSRYTREAGACGYRVCSRALHRRARLDVLWFPFNGPSWTSFALPAIATLHDASTFVLPGFGEESRATFRRAARRCAHVITDSQFSKRELERELLLAPDRVTAIPLGVAAALVASTAAIDVRTFGRFVLFVGESEPRKGLGTLVDAIVALKRDGIELQVVIAGTIGSPIPRAEDIAVHALGYVDDETLAVLYAACAVFVYPSSYEGFGLPVLEAMSYGAPVVASSAAAIPEAGGDAALYAPPGDAHAFAAAIRRVLEEPGRAAALRAAGFARVRQMTWERTAERTLAVFEDVASVRQ